MRGLLVLVLVLVAATPARAEGPITVALGGGPTVMRWEEDGELRFSASLHVDLGFRVSSIAALGVHAGASLGTAATEYVFLGGAEGGYSQAIHYTPLQLGIGATVAPSERWWLSPWLGILDIQTRDGAYYQRPRTTAAGIDAGYDLYAKGGERLSLFGALDTTVAADTFESFKALTVGVAYRYW